MTDKVRAIIENDHAHNQDLIKKMRDTAIQMNDPTLRLRTHQLINRIEEYENSNYVLKLQNLRLKEESDLYGVLQEAVSEGRASILVEGVTDTIDGSMTFTDLQDAIDAIKENKHE